MKRYGVLSCWVLLGVGLWCVPCVLGTALDDYVAESDSAYRYEVVRTVEGDEGTGYVLDMVSQRWRNEAEVNRTEWRHWLHIFVPRVVRHDKGLLVIDGGRNGAAMPQDVDGAIASVARRTGSVTARVKMIPNEPLRFRGERSERWEDSIIAYSWDKYMMTGDETWPLQLPMVKSAVRAMDTVQEFVGKQTGNVEIDGFVVTGASKRGWTTWLTAAVDKRVVAIAPMVIDMLNSEESFRHHRAVYGFYAPAVHDYEEMGIFARLGTPVSERLMKIVDPYSYRDRLTMPKYIINSTGDQFFVPDSWRFYYDGLKGPRFMRYVPNCGHGLKNSDALQSLLMFYEAVIEGWELPQFNFYSSRNGTVSVKPVDEPDAVLLWQATNRKARDFRIDVLGAKWVSSPVSAAADGSYSVTVEKPGRGFTAFFVELTYQSPGEYPWKFTTGTQVVPDIRPYAGKGGKQASKTGN